MFFFKDTATTEIYTLSLHDALPISPREPLRGCHRSPRGASRRGHKLLPRPAGGRGSRRSRASRRRRGGSATARPQESLPDRKSTRLNSSHANISYAVFCLKKKKRPT